MTEKKSKPSNLEWIKKLNSGNEKLIKESLEKLRRKGNKDLIPEIGSLLLSKHSEEINKSVFAFFADLKEQISVVKYVQFLSENRNIKDYHLLISACWENGLDYSEHIHFFVDLILKEAYLTAVEAFTVVEENIDKLNLQKRNELSEYINEQSKKVPQEKAALINELISIVKPMEGPFSLDSEE